MQIINKEQAIKLMQSTNGRVFSVIFNKKDGEVRHLNCRLGVHKYVNGKGMSYDPKQYDLMTVFDMQKNGYRMINLQNLLQIQVDGKFYAVQ